MAQEIKAGNIVQLKTGGPRMTVEWVDNEKNECYCVWFTGKASQKSGEKFALTSLIKIAD